MLISRNTHVFDIRMNLSVRALLHHGLLLQRLLHAYPDTVVLREWLEDFPLADSHVVLVLDLLPNTLEASIRTLWSRMTLWTRTKTPAEALKKTKTYCAQRPRPVK